MINKINKITLTIIIAIATGNIYAQNKNSPVTLQEIPQIKLIPEKPQLTNKLPPQVLSALKKAKVPASNISAMVVPISAAGITKAPTLNWQTSAQLNPASVMKLITTYAGLDILGGTYFWKTKIDIRGKIENNILKGDLIIRGSGDPKLVIERIQELISAIKEKGINKIEGNIWLDNNIFDLKEHNPAAFDDEALRPYNAGPDGLLLNFKALTFKFNPSAEQSNAEIITEPPIAQVEIPREIKTTQTICGNWRSKLSATFGKEKINFAGQYPVQCGQQEWSIAYPDPERYAPRVMKAVWEESGGEISGQVHWLPKNFPNIKVEPLVVGFSLPLYEIIKDINKFSNNVMAQQLFLTLSAGEYESTGKKASFEASRAIVQEWWRKNFGQDGIPKIDNGAGLSRTARISTKSLIQLLSHAAAGKNAQYFEQSLSIAGIDGTTKTLAARKPNSRIIGNAALKTGTLKDASAIAGYVYGTSGQKYAIAAIINHTNAPAAKPALDALIEWVAHDGN